VTLSIVCYIAPELLVVQDSECLYYSDSEDGNAVNDCFVQDGLDGENDKMNTEIKKQKKKLNKLMDKVKIASLDLAMRAY
jgi:hypothetical protein